MNWIPFAIGDFFDEVTIHATELNWVEYAAFAFTIILTIYELRNISLIKITLMLIKKYIILAFLSVKKLLLRLRP